MKSRCSVAAITAWLAVSVAVGDVIVMKTGEQITGTVTRFERGEHSLANSQFVVEVDGKEQSILLFKVETVTFGKGGAPVTPRPATASAVTTPAPRPSPAVKPSPSQYPKNHGSTGRFTGGNSIPVAAILWRLRFFGPRHVAASSSVVTVTVSNLSP